MTRKLPAYTSWSQIEGSDILAAPLLPMHFNSRSDRDLWAATARRGGAEQGGPLLVNQNVDQAAERIANVEPAHVPGLAGRPMLRQEPEPPGLTKAE